MSPARTLAKAIFDRCRQEIMKIGGLPAREQFKSAIPSSVKDRESFALGYTYGVATVLQQVERMQVMVDQIIQEDETRKTKDATMSVLRGMRKDEYDA